MRRTLEVPNETGVPAQAWRWTMSCCRRPRFDPVRHEARVFGTRCPQKMRSGTCQRLPASLIQPPSGAVAGRDQEEDQLAGTCEAQAQIQARGASARRDGIHSIQTSSLPGSALPHARSSGRWRLYPHSGIQLARVRAGPTVRLKEHQWLTLHHTK